MILRAILTLATWVLLSAQSPIPGFPPGLFGSREALSPSTATYTGPGDIVSGATTFVGLTAYTAAYATGLGNAIDVCDTATGLTCTTGIKFLATGYINATAVAALPACAIKCSVTKGYDQTGNGNDWTKTANTAPVLTFSCLGALPCLTSKATATTTNWLTPAIALIAQPFTYTRVALNISGVGSFLATPTTNAQANYGINLATCFAGSNANTAASDGSWHSINTVFSNAASDINVDGVQATKTCGTNNLSGQLSLNDGGTYAGTFMEIGVWPSAISAANSTTMSTNRKAVYGY